MLTNKQIQDTVNATSPASYKIAYSLNNMTWTDIYDDVLKLYTAEERDWRKLNGMGKQVISITNIARIRMLHNILEFVLDVQKLPELADYNWIARRVFVTAAVCAGHRERILRALVDFDTVKLLEITREFIDSFEYQ